MWVERCGDIIEMLGEGDGDMIEVWVELSQLVGALNPVNHRGLHQGWGRTRRRL